MLIALLATLAHADDRALLVFTESNGYPFALLDVAPETARPIVADAIAGAPSTRRSAALPVSALGGAQIGDGWTTWSVSRGEPAGRCEISQLRAEGPLAAYARDDLSDLERTSACNDVDLVADLGCSGDPKDTAQLALPFDATPPTLFAPAPDGYRDPTDTDAVRDWVAASPAADAAWASAADQARRRDKPPTAVTATIHTRRVQGADDRAEGRELILADIYINARHAGYPPPAGRIRGVFERTPGGELEALYLVDGQVDAILGAIDLGADGAIEVLERDGSDYALRRSDGSAIARARYSDACGC